MRVLVDWPGVPCGMPTLNSVFPAMMTSPFLSRTAWARRAASWGASPLRLPPRSSPLTRVPFLLPRSRSSQSGGFASMRKWLAEM